MISVAHHQPEVNLVTDYEDILAAVLTASEVAELYHLDPNVVRITIAKGWLPEGTYRKSGGVWLILREAAEERWGNRQPRPGPKRRT